MKSFFGNAAGIVDVLPCPETEVKGELCFPNPVLLSACAKKYGFDHRQVFYIGSRIEALRSAWAAGTRSALVRTGKPFRTLQILRNSTQQPDVLQNDLLSTVIRIRSIWSKLITASRFQKVSGFPNLGKFHIRIEFLNPCHLVFGFLLVIRFCSMTRGARTFRSSGY